MGSPRLESVKLHNCYQFNWLDMDVSTLIEVKLNFELLVKYESVEEDACKEHQDIVTELLQSLHHVKNLTVGKWCLMFLVKSLDEVNHCRLKEVYFKSMLQCLKTVKIFGFGEFPHKASIHFCGTSSTYVCKGVGEDGFQ
ncbi:hypothetical protein CFP56_041506 [Quercus suber]|uniref:FBD domain-containing protein n=1 Tax=Quercus suber TaxID=58331 RepID=A0AAW0IVR1_QUESU